MLFSDKTERNGGKLLWGNVQFYDFVCLCFKENIVNLHRQNMNL